MTLDDYINRMAKLDPAWARRCKKVRPIVRLVMLSILQRRAEGLTQKAQAEKLGISLYQLRRFETFQIDSGPVYNRFKTALSQ